MYQRKPCRVAGGRNGTLFYFLFQVHRDDWVHRNELVYLFPNRGKYIADSSLVTGDMVTHEIFGERVRKCIMPIDIGGNHHYRQTVVDIESNEWILDNVTYKYPELFQSRFTEIGNALHIYPCNHSNKLYS